MKQEENVSWLDLAKRSYRIARENDGMAIEALIYHIDEWIRTNPMKVLSAVVLSIGFAIAAFFGGA